MGDDVVIPEALTATIVDDQTINSIQLMNGFLIVEQTGSLRFLNLDVLVQGDFTASLDNYGSITGDLRENQAAVKNFAGATWVGDVLDNPNTIENRDSATWDGDVHNSGSLFNINDLANADRPQWMGDVIVNDGMIIQKHGDWYGDIILNNYYIDSMLNSTWTGDIQDNTADIYNSDTGTWAGNVVNNSSTGYIANYDAESTWNGDVLANSGIIYNAGAWNGAVLSNNGTISTAGAWNGSINNSGTLRVRTGGSVSGDVVNSGTLIFDLGDTSTYAGVISGSGTLTKSGVGTLVLSGINTYVGATTVNAGTLSVGGSIAASALTVNGGTLKGSGTVGATSIASGLLAAGNSIGTLNIAGSLDLGAAAVLQVEVAAGGNTAGVHSDLVAVNGAVNIDPAATVQVRPVNGADNGKTYAAGTTYTIMTSTGLNGTFAAVTDDFAFLDSTLSYNPNNAYLTLKRNDTGLADIADTSNQVGAANALDAFGPGDPVTDALMGLSAADAKRAYELASGDSHASAQAVLDQTFSLFQGAMGGSGGGSGAVMSYLDAGVGLVGAVGSTEPVVAPLAANAVWLTPMAGRGVIDNDGNGAATEWVAGGLAAGYERRSTLSGGDVVAGLGVGYTVATASTPTRLATSNAQGGQVGLYGEWSDDAAAFSASLSYGANHISSTRDIVIGGLTNTATAQYWMQGVDTKLMAGYGFELSDGLKVGPLAGMALGWSGHGGFSEAGAGGLNATVAASSTWRLESALGVQLAYELDGGADAFEISGRALWLHNFGDNVTTSTVTLAGGGAPFSVASPTSGRDRLELGAGLAWSASEQTTLSLDYTGRFFGGRTDHTAKAGLTLEF